MAGVSSTLTVGRFGSIARDLLQEGGTASVLGRTSRGLFLHLLSNRVVFLSQEAYCGPLTLNIAGDLSQIPDLSQTSGARLIAEGIFFPDPGLLVDTRHASPWTAPPRPAQVLPPGVRWERWAQVAKIGIAKKPTGAFIPLLRYLVDGVRETEKAVDSVTILTALDGFLGYGAGLTPSGDDLVIGLLLALNRWGDVLAPGIDRSSLNQVLLSRIYQKTTALSASLIECAIQGQADQRLIAALDGLVTGDTNAEACAACLDSWGSSSGFDALVGMALVLRTG